MTNAHKYLGEGGAKNGVKICDMPISTLKKEVPRMAYMAAMMKRIKKALHTGTTAKDTAVINLAYMTNRNKKTKSIERT